MNITQDPSSTPFDGSIPQALKYSYALKPESIPSTHSKRRYYPNGTNSFDQSNNIITIDVMTSPDQMMDTSQCKLHFDIGCATNATSAAYLDTSFYSAIQKVTIRGPDGTQIEQLDNYGSVVNSLMSYQADRALRDASSQLGFPLQNGLGQAATTTGATALVDLGEIRSNQSYVFAQATAASANKVTAEIPLLAIGMLNIHHNQAGNFLPTGLISKFTIEITLEPTIAKVFKASIAPTSYTVNNVYFDASVVTVDAQTSRDMKASLMAAGGKLNLSTFQWFNSVYVPSATQSSYKISSRGRSVRALLVKAVRAAAIDTVYDASIPFADGQLIVNGSYYPSASLNNPSAQLSETCQALGLGSLPKGIVNVRNYYGVAGAFNGAIDGSVVTRPILCFNLDAFPHGDVEAGSKVPSGLIDVNITTTANTAGDVLLNYVLVDSVLQFDLATGSVVSNYA